MKVLAAVDPGDACYDGVLRAAAHLASGDPLQVVHVYPAPLVGYQEVPIQTREDATIQAREAIQARIERDLKERGIAGDVAVPVSGRPNCGDELVSRAEENGVDLVVIGTLGETGLRRLLLGSVAERVVRLAPCSVFIVRPTAAPGT